LKRQLELENSYLRDEVKEARSFGGIIGQSQVLKRLLRQVEMVARTDATVLILGESGTGKELVAREIHQSSRRSQRPLIRVNCASIPRELYESGLFGHVKGAFNISSRPISPMPIANPIRHPTMPRGICDQTLPGNGLLERVAGGEGTLRQF